MFCVWLDDEGVEMFVLEILDRGDKSRDVEKELLEYLYKRFVVLDGFDEFIVFGKCKIEELDLGDEKFKRLKFNDCSFVGLCLGMDFSEWWNWMFYFEKIELVIG